MQPTGAECVIIHNMAVADSEFSCHLSREHIREMAPDYPTSRAADDLALGDKWGAAGWGDTPSGDRLLWAEFVEGKRAPTRVTASLPAMRLTCSCAALRFPCRHMIALLSRHLAGTLPPGAVPDWVTGLERGPAPGAHAKDSPDNPVRRAALVAGMADLARWLGDMVGQGLAAQARGNRAPWLDAANRLVDAYAFEAARELRDMSAIPGSGPDWPERLLPRMGRLALLCEAFRRFDELSPAERADALAAAARSPRPEGPPVAGDWLVVGHRAETEGRQLRIRTWLYGVTARRWAVLSDTIAGGRLDGFHLPTGATARGELAFIPGAWPVSARPVSPLRLAPPVDGSGTGMAMTIDEAIAGYAAALSANPWLSAYPMTLREVFVEPPEPGRKGWRLRDRDGLLLPLPEPFAHGWRLLSLSAGRPPALFGEWDNGVFVPLSVFDGGWQAMAGRREVP